MLLQIRRAFAAEAPWADSKDDCLRAVELWGAAMAETDVSFCNSALFWNPAAFVKEAPDRPPGPASRPFLPSSMPWLSSVANLLGQWPWAWASLTHLVDEHRFYCSPWWTTAVPVQLEAADLMYVDMVESVVQPVQAMLLATASRTCRDIFVEARDPVSGETQRLAIECAGGEAFWIQPSHARVWVRWSCRFTQTPPPCCAETVILHAYPADWQLASRPNAPLQIFGTALEDAKPRRMNLLPVHL